MSQRDFVHLHVHSEYSLLDGLSNIKKLFAHVKEQGMKAIALTDHGVMHGAVEFYKEGLKQEIKPIIGMEGYITTDPDMRVRPEKGTSKNYHLLLLAKNYEGYKNLMKLSSEAQIYGFYKRPRFDRETLKKYSKGLIVTSACPQGELGQAIIEEDEKKIKEIVSWYQETFKDDYYLEIQRHNLDYYAQKATLPDVRADLLNFAKNSDLINTTVVNLSRELGIPLVATNDAHYIKKEDAPAQDALVCIATGKNVTDTKRMRYIDTPAFYITTAAEMEELFPDLPDALDNTVKVAQKCNLLIETLGKWFFPKFDLPQGITEDEQLRKLTFDGLEQKVGKTEESVARVEKELDIIKTKGYSAYFLIMMDMVNWANDQGIITNTRGSAAGSLVSYILGITTVNPLEYYLPFERFLNPFRPSPPDIDLDIADDKREQMIAYITNKYGVEKVAQICTFGRMLSRAAVRDVARVLGFPYVVGDRIAKLIPPPKQGFPITIPKALAEVPELKQLYDNDKDTQTVLDMAIQLEGSARHLSVHAAGVVVAQTELTDFAPIQKEPSGDKIITQYEFHTCEEVGLIKFDVLGIRNLSILNSAIDIVEVQTGVRIDIHKIPIDDAKTFEMLARGETMGVFQMGSSGMTKWIMELAPTRVEDLMAMVALYRPGPMATIPDYIERKRNPELVKYLDPRMEKYLGASYGLLVYQDDLLFSALELAGYNWEEVDKFRKAVGKKIPEEMAAQKQKFTQGVVANGQTQEFADKIWKLFEPFQSYGFNKAHAASYGMVSYQTAYMKANYPVEYMTALLTAESKDADKISTAISECRRMKIKVLPPDINESQIGFTITQDEESLNGKAIRFGLDAIKNVGKAALEAIFEVRNEGKFNSFVELISRVDGRRVNKKVLESLIKVGAMSSFGTRAALLDAMDAIKNKVSKPKSTIVGQQDLFGDDDKQKIAAAPSVIISDVAEFEDNQLEALERELLGFSLTGKPIDEIIAPYQHLATHKIYDLNGVNEHISEGSMVKLAAVVSEVRVVITKKTSAEMAFVKVADETGTIDLVIFPQLYQKTKNTWLQNTPLLVSGKLDRRDDSTSILVDSIESRDSIASNSADVLHINIPANATSENLTNLKDLLLSNPGEQSVKLVFEANGKEMDLPFRVSWSERLARHISEVV
ncbi:MAG: DNA polymerase III subunit alpha [Patescibacteria group bacterium]